MPPKVYRPQTLMALVNPILEVFLEKEKERLVGVLKALVLRNSELHGTQVVTSRYGFYYKGARFTNFTVPQLRGITLTEVHPDCIEEVDYYIACMKDVEAGHKRIKMGLAVIMNRCQSIQDLRDALPEALVSMLPNLRSLARNKPEAWVIQESPELTQEFNSVIALINHFQINRLIFS